MHPSISTCSYNKHCACYYNINDAAMYHSLNDVLPDVISDLTHFYDIRDVPYFTVFMYPDGASMSEAFNRALPNDQCCFVPIKNAYPLITFTARIAMTSVKQVLIHELSHIVFAQVTGAHEINDVQQTIPVWIDEGIALYLDSAYRSDLDALKQKRVQMIKQCGPNALPRLSSQYTYFNKLDTDNEFGPIGMAAYAYSYFCISMLIKQSNHATVMHFLKSLAVTTADLDDLFHSSFGISIDTFDNNMREGVF